MKSDLIAKGPTVTEQLTQKNLDVWIVKVLYEIKFYVKKTTLL